MSQANLWRTVNITSQMTLKVSNIDTSKIEPGKYKVKITNQEGILWAEFKKGRRILGGIAAKALWWHISTDHREKSRVETTTNISNCIWEDMLNTEETIEA